MSKRMTLLWITPKYPFPATDGARVATTELVKNLSERGVKIHLVSIVPRNEFPRHPSAEARARTRVMNELGVADFSMVPRAPSNRFYQVLSTLLRPWTPITLAAYASSDVKRAIHQITEKNRPDLIVYDGLHAAAGMICTFPGFFSKTSQYSVAYRAHNVESDIWFRAAANTRNLLKKWILFWQGMLVRSVELRLAHCSSFLFPVSSTDEAHFKKHGLSTVIRSLPIGIRVKSSTRVPFGSGEAANPLKPLRSILFIGKLDWPPNREGLSWVLQNVWPQAHAQAPDLILKIVGSGEKSWLDAYRNTPGVEIIGPTEDVSPHYENSLISLVPVFYGSGTRVKAIESCLYGRACLSTALGVEGIGLLHQETYLQAETADEWIKTLVSLNSNHAREIGERARTHARQMFDPGRIADRFIETVSSKQ